MAEYRQSFAIETTHAIRISSFAELLRIWTLPSQSVEVPRCRPAPTEFLRAEFLQFPGVPGPPHGIAHKCAIVLHSCR